MNNRLKSGLEFEELWHRCSGSVMLKTDNHSQEWRKTIARYFWDNRQHEIDQITKENEELKAVCEQKALQISEMSEFLEAFNLTEDYLSWSK